MLTLRLATARGTPSQQDPHALEADILRCWQHPLLTPITAFLAAQTWLGT